MQLQFKKVSSPVLQRVVRDIAADELTQEVRLTEGMPDIGRVIASWGQMVLRSKEWRNGTVSASGGVMVWILYAPEDATEPRCIDSWIPFQLRWEHLDSDREGPVRIVPLLRMVDARTVSARKFMVRTGAAALAEAMCPGQLIHYIPEELPEDIEVLRNTYPVRLPKEAGEKTFQIEETLTVSSHPPAQLISFTIRPDITEQRVAGGRVLFRGNGLLHVVYRCAEGRIRVHDFDVPFSQYGDLDGVYGSDARADVWVGTTGLDLDLDDNGQLHLKCGMVGQYLVDDRELLELVEDAYSPARNVSVHTEPLIVPSVLDRREENVPVSQTLPESSGENVEIQFLPDYPRMRRYGDELSADLAGMFQMLWYDNEGGLQSGNAGWEGKLTVPAGETSRMDFRIGSVGPTEARPSADGFEMKSNVRLLMDTRCDGEMPMVTGLEVGEQSLPNPDRPSLILCNPGDESLWQLAKRCGSTVDAIRKANGLEEETAAARLLLVPIQ